MPVVILKSQWLWAEAEHPFLPNPQSPPNLPLKTVYTKSSATKIAQFKLFSYFMSFEMQLGFSSYIKYRANHDIQL